MYKVYEMLKKSKPTDQDILRINNMDGEVVKEGVMEYLLTLKRDKYMQEDKELLVK